MEQKTIEGLMVLGIVLAVIGVDVLLERTGRTTFSEYYWAKVPREAKIMVLAASMIMAILHSVFFHSNAGWLWFSAMLTMHLNGDFMVKK